MAVNIHDSANALEQAIRQSNEFTELKKMYDLVNADPSAKAMFDNFRNIQLQIQQKQMSGQEITPEEIEHAQKTVALVQQHETIAKLMQAEQSMSMVIQELNQIIMKPLEELYGAVQGQ